jgi:hypothetical protein
MTLARVSATVAATVAGVLFVLLLSSSRMEVVSVCDARPGPAGAAALPA